MCSFVNEMPISFSTTSPRKPYGGFEQNAVRVAAPRLSAGNSSLVERFLKVANRSSGSIDRSMNNSLTRDTGRHVLVVMPRRTSRKKPVAWHKHNMSHAEKE